MNYSVLVHGDNILRAHARICEGWEAANSFDLLDCGCFLDGKLLQMTLTKIEREICGIVVRRFWKQHEATPRNDLLRAFKTPLYEPLQNLTNRSVLSAANQMAGAETYLPRAIAFLYCGDAEAITLARRSVEIVLQVLRQLFDVQLETGRKEPFTLENAVTEAMRMSHDVNADMVWLGLYFAQEFSVFSTRQMDAKQIGVEAFLLSEQIYRVAATEYLWDSHIQEGIKSVEYDWKNAQIDLSQNELEVQKLEAFGIESQEPTEKSKTVFVIHGRDERLREGVFAFLRALRLEPLEWIKAIQLTGKASPYIGEILDAAFKKAQAVVVLVSPDDEAKLCARLLHPDDPASERELTGQARPNVLFEAGMAFGSHGGRTVLLQFGEVRPFSDVAGRHIVKMDNSTKKRQELAAKLKTAGCSVDTDGADWLTTGDLTPPPAKSKTSSGIELPQQVSNIVCLKSLSQPRCVAQDGKGMWKEVGPGGEGLFAATAIFRNEPIKGLTFKYIRDLVAQITFFAPTGGEVQRVNRGVWLNNYDEGYTQTGLTVGDTLELLIAVKEHDSPFAFSVEGTTRLEKPLALPLYDVTVKLIGIVANRGDVNDEFRFNLDLREETPILRLGWSK